MNSQKAASSSSLASPLRSVRVGLREDLEVSRHLFRGEPAYIVRDPITFQSQRLTPEDYAIFVRIHNGIPLCEVFNGLVDRGQAQTDDEEPFYRFIMQLHQLGFLHLPIADHKRLYRRYQMKQRGKLKEKLMGFLFLRIPLCNPSAFLDRTIDRVRPLFSRTAFFLWIVLMLSAGFIAVHHRQELTQPLEGLLATRNLVLMWITLIVLKVFHEFGHAYACRNYGGYVPEMGAYLILFTPCAYMDATACWGFPRRRDRLVVCLAGMYVESIMAAFAVFVWAWTGPSLLHSLAYNVVFLAGLITVLFNVNPLMRYDGYYVLSDLTEVPNLRARSSRYLLDWLKRRLLGIRAPTAKPLGWRLRTLLFSFGIAAFLYRSFLLLAIAMILAGKMFLVGLALAVAYLGSTIFGCLRGLVFYLWQAEETAPVRRRAVAWGVLGLMAVPAALALIPVPCQVRAQGLVTAENETVIRAKRTGFLQQTNVACGDVTKRGMLLAVLTDDSIQEKIAAAKANLRSAQILRDAYQFTDPSRAQQEQYRVQALQKSLDQAQTGLADLQITAPVDGAVITAPSPGDTGAFFRKGDPIATIISGRWRVRAILTEEQLAGASPRPGDPVRVRVAAMPSQTLSGTIDRIAPAGSRTIALPRLTQSAGGRITVDPSTQRAAEPYFEITIDLIDVHPGFLRHGMTGFVLLQGTAEPVASRLYRRMSRFLSRLMEER